MKSIPLLLLTAALAHAQATRAVNGQIDPRRPAQPASFDCAVDGTVVNAVTGEPIVRARVNAMFGGSANSTATGNSGKWALSGLACAPGQLLVTRPGFLQNGGNGTGGSSRSLTLVSGSPVHDLKMELIPQSVAFGKVLDDQGDPVTNAQVTVLVSHVTEGRARFQQAGSANTNDLGEYRVANLPRGKYIVCVHPNPQNGPLQFASQTIAADACYPGPLEGGTASALDLPAGRESKVDFSLNEVQPVHIRGIISGLPNARGSGLNLVRRGVNADFGGNLPGTVREGTFEYRVPPGSYLLTADYFEAGKHLSARVPIDAAGADIDNVVVHLDSGFTVTGTVRLVSQSGQTAIPRFGINLVPTEAANGTGQLKWEPDRAAFAFNEMVPGNYRLNVFPPAPFYVKSATLSGQDVLNNEILFSQAGGPIEIVLCDDGGSIEGDVVDSNGQPVAAGILLMRDTSRAANQISQPNGHFKLQNIAPGDYTIYAWDEPNEVQYADPDWMRRYAGGGTPVTVAANQNQQVKLTRQPVPAQ